MTEPSLAIIAAVLPDPPIRKPRRSYPRKQGMSELEKAQADYQARQERLRCEAHPDQGCTHSAGKRVAEATAPAQSDASRSGWRTLPGTTGMLTLPVADGWLDCPEYSED